MSQRDAYLQTILEQPRRPEPRLRFAEWLDDQCDPLGEFIRVQHRLAATPAADERLFELEVRDRELRAEYAADWLGELAGVVDWAAFHGGFVEEVALTAAAFLEHAGALFRRAPVRVVHLRRVRDRVEELAASPFLAKIDFLDLSAEPLRDFGVSLLAGSDRLAGVRGLNLSSVGLGDAGAKALAASPHVGRLRELYLTNNHVGNAGGKALAAAPRLGELEALDLAFNALGREGERALCGRFGKRVRL